MPVVEKICIKWLEVTCNAREIRLPTGSCSKTGNCAALSKKTICMMRCWCWYVDSNMIGNGDHKPDKDRSHSSEYQTILENDFSPENHFGLKWYHQSNICYGGTTAGHVYTESDEVRSHKCWVIKPFSKNNFVPNITHASSFITEVFYTLKVWQQGKFKASLLILGTTAAE